MAFDEEVQDNSRELAARAEKIKNELENANPEINAQVFVYPPNEAKRPERKLKSKERFAIPKTRIVDQFPEAREEAEEVYEQIMDRGAVLCYSKILGDHQEFSDFVVVYTGGKAKDLDEVWSFFMGNPIDRYRRPLFNSGGDLFDDDNQELTAIFTHLQSIDEIQAEAGEEMLTEVAENDRNNEVMFMDHSYPSKTRLRGHKIATQMLYIMPGEIGKQWEQRVFEHPWLMEALSEVVVEKAGDELKAQSPQDFKFLALHENDMSRTQMHEPSGAKEIAMAVSFYNK